MLNDQVFSAMIDDEFKKDKNPHKYALLWTSKFYIRVKDFIKNYIKYFYAHEIKAKILYRGYKSNFQFTRDIDDPGFISASRKEHVAQEFAGNNGTVLKFKTKKLPSDVPFVQITRIIVPHSSEKEIVFLPGKITDGDSYATYKANLDLVNMYMSVPMLGGGKGLTKDWFTDLQIDLRDKLVVWHRAIYNRPAEVVAVTRLPKTVQGVQKFWHNIEKSDQEYEDMNLFIPEYQDLVQECKNNPKSNASKKIMSFTVHTAIVERKTHNILTLHYGIPKQMFHELFEVSREKEAIEAIKKRLHGIPFY